MQCVLQAKASCYYAGGVHTKLWYGMCVRVQTRPNSLNFMESIEKQRVGHLIYHKNGQIQTSLKMCALEITRKVVFFEIFFHGFKCTN